MDYIQKFLNLYLIRKIKNDSFKLILNFSIFVIIFIIIITAIEKNAYFPPYIKVKILNIFLILSVLSLLFLIIRIIIHKYGFWNNSNHQILARELINKLPVKDRIINVLQIYSKLDLKSPYSDLTIKAINDLKKDIKTITIQNIKFYFPYRILYLLILLTTLFSFLILFSNQYHDAFMRIINNQVYFHKPLPFELKINNLNYKNYIFKGDELKLIINGMGNLPNQIELNWMINGKINTKKINKIDTSYVHIFKNINTNMKIWADYSNNPILVYNKYKIETDTLNIILKERPEIKNLTITIQPPPYTNIDKLEHNQSLSKIDLLEGSKLNLKGITNKKLKWAKLNFKNDSIIHMHINNNVINAKFEVFESTDFEIKCADFNNNENIKIKYFINIINDLKPYVNIKYPNNNFKINENYNIDLSVEIFDDFGVERATLEYYVVKPYYLNQDTTLNQISILNTKERKTNEYVNYNWNLFNLNISPGDEIFYWVKGFDNNTKTGPGIGKSEILRAYFPSLEELYFEVEQEQEVVEETFEEMINSIDEIKNMYETISNDVLKEQLDLEQEQESKKMAKELDKISEKIETLEKTIKTIEELNDKNNLINEALGEKIEKLQQMFQDAISPDLMQALQKLQESLNKDDFEKSLEQLNKFDFEINDLEQQLDRMIELFEQVVAEQKLDELTKKIESMQNLQNEVTEKINENAQNPNIDAMENKQNNNLNDFMKTLDETNKLMQNIDEKISQEINELSNNQELSEIKKELENILNRSENNPSTMNQSSQNIENNIQNISDEMKKIIENYKKKTMIEMLNMYTRIIKNLIDMSYEQENIIQASKNIKSKTNTNIKKITSKENTILQQYKNIFIQISDLSKKSFHITSETSKTFSQIFNHLVKTISAFEKGKITIAKGNQITVMEYINKTILLLIDAMSNMQASGEASGYSQYLESMEQLTKGQESLNQGMGSLLPMPFGQQPGSEGLMQSLMQQQQQLMQKLEELLNNNSFHPSNNEGEGLGKALNDMNEIIKDFENNNISQESIERGQRVYRKLLEHQNALKNRGFDEKWEADQNNNKNLLNNDIIRFESTNNSELKELYKTLDELDDNKNLTKENKTIIQEYLRILIKENLDEK